MGMAMIIVGGIVLISVVTSVFDFLGKRRGGKKDREFERRIETMEQRLKELEQGSLEKDEKIRSLSGELSFLNKLIEDRSKQ